MGAGQALVLQQAHLCLSLPVSSDNSDRAPRGSMRHYGNVSEAVVIKLSAKACEKIRNRSNEEIVRELQVSASEKGKR